MKLYLVALLRPTPERRAFLRIASVCMMAIAGWALGYHFSPLLSLAGYLLPFGVVWFFAARKTRTIDSGF